MIDREWLSDEEVERIATETEDAGHGWAGNVKTISHHGFFSPEALRHFVNQLSSAVAKKAAEAEREKLNDAMDSFWTMLKECEASADNRDDRVLKHWVEAWHSQYARITGREIKEPRWIERARGTGGEG